MTVKQRVHRTPGGFQVGRLVTVPADFCDKYDLSAIRFQIVRITKVTESSIPVYYRIHAENPAIRWQYVEGAERFFLEVTT